MSFIRTRSNSLPTVATRSNPSQWKPADVIQWLGSLKLGEYSKLFAAAHVDGVQLLQLNHEKMLSMGIRRIGHILRLKTAIKQLKNGSVEDNKSSSSNNKDDKKDMFAFQTLSPETEVGIKCVLGDDISVLRLPYNKLQWKELKACLTLAYQRPLEIKYRDKEGDIIKLSGETHLSYALEDWKKNRDSRPRAFRLFLQDLSR